MKKVMIAQCVLLLICGVLMAPGCAKKPGSEPSAQSAPAEPAKPVDINEIPTGEEIAFNLTYRGSSGAEDGINVYSWYGFGMIEKCDAPFIKAVQEKVENPIAISPLRLSAGTQYAAVEYKESENLALFFDLDGDGELSDDERIAPAENTRYASTGSTVFITPDFVQETSGGQRAPCRMIAQASFHGRDVPSLMWSMLGFYEGTAQVNGQDMRLHLFNSMYNGVYSAFGQSDYALVPTSHEPGKWLGRSRLSSLISKEETFYRVRFEPVNEDVNSLGVRFYEDKSPRGRVAVSVQSDQDLKSRLGYAWIQGTTDGTIYFNLNGHVNELPVGDYRITSGGLSYGQEKADEYSTSLSTLPSFAVNTDQTTTLEIGKARAEILTVEESKRYHGDKKYKTEFPAGTALFLDIKVSGMAGETYSSFSKRVKDENNRVRSEDIKGRIRIVDDKQNEIVSQDLEYG